MIRYESLTWTEKLTVSPHVTKNKKEETKSKQTPVRSEYMIFKSFLKVKERSSTWYSAQVDTATTKALRYMVRTKQRRTYLPYTFPAVAGTHLPTPRGWRVE